MFPLFQIDGAGDAGHEDQTSSKVSAYRDQVQPTELNHLTSTYAYQPSYVRSFYNHYPAYQSHQDYNHHDEGRYQDHQPRPHVVPVTASAAAPPPGYYPHYHHNQYRHKPTYSKRLAYHAPYKTYNYDYGVEPLANYKSHFYNDNRLAFSNTIPEYSGNSRGFQAKRAYEYTVAVPTTTYRPAPMDHGAYRRSRGKLEFRRTPQGYSYYYTRD